MRIALAQLNQTVGDFERNSKKILEAYARACAQEAQLLITPELSVCGYPPHDLVDRAEMVERNERVMDALTRATAGKKTALAVGHITKNPKPYGRRAQNSVSVLKNGRVEFVQAKTLLPTYDVFDEARYFEPAIDRHPLELAGARLGVAICEDLWAEDPSFGRRLYQADPVVELSRLELSALLSFSASPYMVGKHLHREALHGEAAKAVRAPLIYVNQVGATDEVLFDGGSFVTDARGKLLLRLPFFEEAFATVDLEELPPGADAPMGEHALLKLALVTGIRDYCQKVGIKRVILGLSGGIDSALVATLAVDALGAKNVLGVAMPGPFSSSHALADAEELAANLGISFEVKPIKFSYSVLSRELAEGRGGKLEELALENLQARLRGLTLMTLANHYGAMVLTTGNKSELATGYCTLYGDMAGGLAPIGDLVKTRVYALSRFINEEAGAERIPARSIEKAPSAELRPDQKDQDTLPPYEALDRVLEAYLERGVSAAQLVTDEGDWVRDVLERVERNEHKRKQAAPVLKVTPKAFGIGRRVPLAKVWGI